LAFILLPRVKAYEGQDLSEGMLGRARKRWDRYSGTEKSRYEVPPFSSGDMSVDTEKVPERDWIFMSFSLHLFDPETQKQILARSLAHARKGVVVIDHAQKWQPVVALAEWFEGSHYDQFISVDFSDVARQLNCNLSARKSVDFTLMEFLKSRKD
jgi:hypothetical protein